MMDWLHLLAFIVLGFCDAFDRFSRGNKSPMYSAVTSVDSPKYAFTGSAYSRGVRPLQNCWFYNGQNNNDFYRGRGTSKSSALAPESHSEGLGNEIKNLLSPKLSDHNTRINDNGFNKRRYLWEPIFDGNVIGSIGKLFSDKIKNEADKEREEREKIREEKLLKKYTAMLKDPEQLEKLRKEAANSPSYINQIVRRSFLPSFNEPMQEFVARESSPRNGFGLDKWSRIRGDDDLPIKTISVNFVKPPVPRLQRYPDIFIKFSK